MPCQVELDKISINTAHADPGIEVGAHDHLPRPVLLKWVHGVCGATEDSTRLAMRPIVEHDCVGDLVNLEGTLEPRDGGTFDKDVTPPAKRCQDAAS